MTQLSELAAKILAHLARYASATEWGMAREFKVDEDVVTKALHELQEAGLVQYSDEYGVWELDDELVDCPVCGVKANPDNPFCHACGGNLRMESEAASVVSLGGVDAKDRVQWAVQEAECSSVDELRALIDLAHPQAPTQQFSSIFIPPEAKAADLLKQSNDVRKAQEAARAAIRYWTTVLRILDAEAAKGPGHPGTQPPGGSLQGGANLEQGGVPASCLLGQHIVVNGRCTRCLLRIS